MRQKAKSRPLVDMSLLSEVFLSAQNHFLRLHNVTESAASSYYVPNADAKKGNIVPQSEKNVAYLCFP